MSNICTDQTKSYTHRGVKFYITNRVNFEGTKLWGFFAQSDVRQAPVWHRKKDAIESAQFHINWHINGGCNAARKTEDDTWESGHYVIKRRRYKYPVSSTAYLITVNGITIEECNTLAEARKCLQEWAKPEPVE